MMNQLLKVYPNSIYLPGTASKSMYFLMQDEHMSSMDGRMLIVCTLLTTMRSAQTISRFVLR